MLKLLPLTLSLACGLALSACASTGKGVKPLPVCPVMPPVPPSLMQPPDFEKRMRERLLETPDAPTTGLSGSKTQSERDKALSEFAKDLAELQKAVDEANREIQAMTPEQIEAMCRLENDLRANAGMPPLDCADFAGGE